MLAAVSGIVRRTIRRHAMLRPGTRVLAAVSGGSDSVALLIVLAALRRRLDFDLVAAHVNHRLRGLESDADEACAATAASRLGVPFARADLGDALLAGGNLEERARRLRYRALHDLAAAHGCERIATGHTRDDQAETVLLRIVRGSGPEGLAGVLAQRPDGVIRPLIDCRRAVLRRVVEEAGLEYRTDASNGDPRFLRTHVRERLLPLLSELNPAAVDSLSRLAALAASETEILRAWAHEKAAQVADGQGLDVRRLGEVPEAQRGYVVRAWLAQQGVDIRLGSRHLDGLVGLAAAAGGGGSVRLPGGREVRRRGARLRFGAAAPRTFTPLEIRPGTSVVLESGWQMSAALRRRRAADTMPSDLWSAVCVPAEALQVRPARRGERVRPLGLGGSRKLSDLFVDRKVPREERAGYPVVSCGPDVVWVPGVVRAEALRIEAGEREVLWLSATRAEAAKGRERLAAPRGAGLER